MSVNLEQESAKLRPPVILQPNKPAIASVIWLHGLGASGDDLVPVAAELKLAETLPIRHIFPHAPLRPVTLNQGYVMPAWYDITGPSLLHREDEPGILASEQIISTLIASEVAQGMVSNRIFLAGFSQGGAMALFAGLRHPSPLAGVIALSCYLPLATKYPIAANANKQLPIFLAAGTADMMVQCSWSTATKQLLQSSGHTNLSWHTYPMEHSICLDEIVDIAQWLGRICSNL